jgi:hypothetical protein
MPVAMFVGWILDAITFPYVARIPAVRVCSITDVKRRAVNTFGDGWINWNLRRFSSCSSHQPSEFRIS